ncbi:MAG: hypothetical protein AAF958_17140 [Planctomycetota bacterium]
MTALQPPPLVPANQGVGLASNQEVGGLVELPRCDGNAIDFTLYRAEAAEQFSCDPIRLDFCSFYASAELLFMSREADDFGLSYDLGPSGTATVDLTHGFQPGVRTTLGFRTGTAGHFQISYMGINQWAADNVTANVPLGGGPSLLSSVDEYTANLNDLQFNLVAMDPLADWDWLVGLRLIDQRDEASSVLTLDDGFGNPNSVVSERAFADASNTLLGAQIGTRYGHWFGPMGISGAVKTGLFYNETGQNGSLFAGNIAIDGIDEPTSDVNGSETSVMGDFIAQFSYRVTGNTTYRLGYQGLIFSNIVQATDRDGSAADASTLAYHGLFTGLEWRR